jgi:hypothetical protein
MNTDHSWMPAALSCMAQRFNDHRTVENFNARQVLHDQQHTNRWRYQWRGGHTRPSA